MIQANIVFMLAYLVTFDPIMVEISLYTLLFVQVVSAVCYVLWLRVVYQQDSSRYGWKHLWFRYVCQTVIGCWPILLLMYSQFCRLPLSSTFVMETIALTGFCYICAALWNIHQLTFSPNSSHPLITFSISLISSDMYEGAAILSIGISLLLVTVFAKDPLLLWVVAGVCCLSLSILIWPIIVLVRRKKHTKEKSQEQQRDGFLHKKPKKPDQSIALTIKGVLYGPIIGLLIPRHVLPDYSLPLFFAVCLGLGFLLIGMFLAITLVWRRQMQQQTILWQGPHL